MKYVGVFIVFMATRDMAGLVWCWAMGRSWDAVTPKGHLVALTIWFKLRGRLFRRRKAAALPFIGWTSCRRRGLGTSAGWQKSKRLRGRIASEWCKWRALREVQSSRWNRSEVSCFTSSQGCLRAATDSMLTANYTLGAWLTSCKPSLIRLVNVFTGTGSAVVWSGELG